MKVVLQRVLEASVSVNKEIIGQIQQGWLLLLGISHTDKSTQIVPLCKKIFELRSFNDSKQKMNLSLKDIDGGILVVSQFTLFGDCSKGRRPSFNEAANADHAEKLYLEFIEEFKKLSPKVETGQFGAKMQINTICDGPVTLILET